MKEQKYQGAVRAIEALIETETDRIAVMSTISCELYHAFDTFNWVGFYRRVDERTLKVGPYQGSHGCLSIDIERGVCGKCLHTAEVQLENAACSLPHHIACSSETKAEIVLPIIDSKGEVRAVLDIDATEEGVFDEVDVTHLKGICQWVAERFN
jgi:L-methionine (R)-S-oxide reductase